MELLILALEVLASPVFFTLQLDYSSPLLRICFGYVIKYLDDYNPRIRRAASVTCAAVVDKAASSSSDLEADVVSLLPRIIDALLMAGIGDDSTDIRRGIFSLLTPNLDVYLARSNYIHCLIDALNDESVQVRISAISVLARTSRAYSSFTFSMFNYSS